ncbi:MAG: cohesin domain-containing protein [Saprospiraceae bacterium]
MKKILLAVLPLLMACGARDAAPDATTDTPAAATNTAAVADAEATNADPAGEEGLTIFAPNLSAKSGSNICVDVQAQGFKQLLSMQYTLAWNKNVLEFTELKNFNLPHLDNNDFGLHLAKDGLLTCAWIDDSLKGATVADNAALYQVCFKVKGKAGEESYFKITDRPTSIEVIDLREKSVPLKKKAGSVKVE